MRFWKGWFGMGIWSCRRCVERAFVAEICRGHYGTLFVITVAVGVSYGRLASSLRFNTTQREGWDGTWWCGIYFDALTRRALAALASTD